MLRALYPLVGIGLLALLAWNTDVAAAWDQATAIGWGFGLVLALYFVEFLFDNLAWQTTFQSVPPTPVWIYRLWKVRMVGEAFNVALPAAHIGGEPIKALILNRHYDVGYREGVASLVLGRTIIVMGLVVFLTCGFVLMLGADLPRNYKLSAGVGLVAFSSLIAGFFLVQRLRLLSRFGDAILRGRLNATVAHLRETEDRLVLFYSSSRGRFALALAFSFLNWIGGVVTLYVTLQLLGHPVSWQEAWIIESFTQLVRAGSFFIPANPSIS